VRRPVTSRAMILFMISEVPLQMVPTNAIPMLTLNGILCATKVTASGK
jgi:hypothetical protein